MTEINVIKNQEREVSLAQEDAIQSGILSQEVLCWPLLLTSLPVQYTLTESQDSWIGRDETNQPLHTRSLADSRIHIAKFTTLTTFKRGLQ